MAANGYAVWGTLITGSILVGLFAAPLWTAQCSYFTIASHNYAKLSNEKEEAVVSRFFGVFFMFFQLCELFYVVFQLCDILYVDYKAMDVSYLKCFSAM